MAGKIFDGVISFPEEMKVIKTLFSRQTFGEEKKTISTNSLPKQLRSNSGDEKTKS